MQAISHHYIIECCRRQTLVDVRRFLLPAGWSLLGQQFVRWSLGQAIDQRRSASPFQGRNILIGSDNPDYVTFWTRVCRLAQATVRTVHQGQDIGVQTRGFLLTDEDFSVEIKSKAEHFRIPVVSTVWIVECLVAGALCAPDASEKFHKAYLDDNF